MADGLAGARFSLMDVFANVLPGLTVVTLALVSLWPGTVVDLVTLGVAELTALAVLSMIVGLFLQSLALVEEPVFDAAACRIRGTVGSRLLDPFCRTTFSDRLRAVREAPSTHLEGRFWELCVDRFRLGDDFGGPGDYAELQRSLLAYLEPSPYSQAVRMRALYQLSRGLWSGFSLLLAYYLAAIGFPEHVPMGVAAEGRTVGVATSAVLFLVFFGYKNLFHRLWFEFTVSEFYLDRTADAAG